MQFTLGCIGFSDGYNASAEIAASAPYTSIRTMTVGETTTSVSPLLQLAVAPTLPWSIAGPATIGLGNWSATSAVCWYYAKDLYDALQVPIGIVSSNWGGTIIQSWSDNATNAQCGGAEEEKVVLPEGVEAPRQPHGDGGGPNPNAGHGVLFNAMIYPYTVGPMALSSFIWFQGESNCGGLPSYYACAQSAMIQSWRGYFKNPRAFFGFVTMEPWISGFKGTYLADFRVAQMTSAASLPGVAFATGTDIGDPTGPFGSVHPRNKKAIGRRLAAAALTLLYSTPTPWEPPRLVASKAAPASGGSAVTLTFAPVPTSLVAAEDHCKTELGVSASQCAYFYIVGTDSKMYNASVTSVAGASVTIQATPPLPAGVTANGTSFGYGTWPINVVMSSENIPLLPWPATPLSG